MPPSETAIQEQWEKLRSHGSPAALKWLFDRLYDDLFAYAVRKTGSRDVSKDVLQNTFADLWYYRNRLSKTTSVKAYLFRAVSNHCAKFGKLNGNSVPLEEIAQQLIFQPEELKVYSGSGMKNQRIKKILESCTPRQKEILYLRYYDNLDYREIADVMGIAYQTVINHAHEAIVKLRQVRKLKELLTEN